MIVILSSIEHSFYLRNNHNSTYSVSKLIIDDGMPE